MAGIGLRGWDESEEIANTVVTSRYRPFTILARAPGLRVAGPVALDAGVEQISTQCGLGSATNLRARFHNAVGTTHHLPKVLPSTHRMKSKWRPERARVMRTGAAVMPAATRGGGEIGWQPVPLPGRASRVTRRARPGGTDTADAGARTRARRRVARLRIGTVVVRLARRRSSRTISPRPTGPPTTDRQSAALDHRVQRADERSSHRVYAPFACRAD